MKDLIEALQIFLKYGNEEYPTHCEHGALYVYGVNPDAVSAEDKKRLEELSFFFAAERGRFGSPRYGSC